MKLVFTIGVLAAAGFAWFLWSRLVGAQVIETVPKPSEAEVAEMTDNPEFAIFLQRFQPVSLPLQVKSDEIDFQRFPELEAADFLPNFDRAGSILANMGVDISNIPDVALNAAVPVDPDLERLTPRAFYAPYLGSDVFGLLFLVKEYNDRQRIKQLKVYLSTYDRNGRVIDTKIIGIQSHRYDQQNKEVYAQYVMLRFEASRRIERRLKTWQFMDRGGYGTGGWQDQEGWFVDGSGMITAEGQKPIPRDEL